MPELPPAPYLSVVIPAYNEAQRLGPSLERILAYLADRPFAAEIVVVDDGSTDGTGDLARQLLEGRADYQVLRNEPNAGKAVSVRRGLLAGRGQVLLFSDADLSTPIEEADRLLAELEAGADVAIASRQLPGARLAVHQPWYRELAGRAFGWVNQMVLLPGIPDSQCGFKAFRREAAHALLPHQRLSGWAFDAELLYVARRLGLKIAQVPVTWINDPASKVHMVRDGLRMVLDLFRIRRLHRHLRPL
ncbi:MAG: glycosyltransferase family 2 protein [Armatimonadetes bacterium]|nr:glycosyltransferase family 2 protein [Armatimonadota bacterium]